jgi:glycine dehydrogenase subunit 2
MHEALFSDAFLKDTGVETIDIAKAPHRRGLSPDDDVLPAGRPRRDADRADRDGSKAELDRFCDALASIARRATQKDPSLKPRPTSRRPNASTRRARRARRASNGRRRRRH